MQLGMIGLGRMGGNMVRRLMKGGHQCVVFDLNPENVKGLVAEGATGAATMEEFVQKLTKPRAAWVMVPAGDATETTVMKLAGLMESGDTIIDGGNSYFKDDIRRSKVLKDKGIHYVDVGTSGGVWGIERGYCMMLGGSKESVDRLDPIFKTLAPGKGDTEATPGRQGKKSTAESGYLYCGASGGGHFVKMVHNGIEYGLMQAYAEGFDIMRNANSQKSRKIIASPLTFPISQSCGVAAAWWVRGSWTSPPWRSPKIPIFRASQAPCRIPAKAAGPSWPLSKKPFPAMCFPHRSIRASARARITRSPKRCCPACAISSAATWNAPQAVDRSLVVAFPT